MGRDSYLVVALWAERRKRLDALLLSALLREFYGQIELLNALESGSVGQLLRILPLVWVAESSPTWEA